VNDTRLIVIRGNSGSGKSSVAAELRQAYGRGVAVVSQDLMRRVVLREPDHPDAVNIGLIDQTVRYSLAHGYHVALDGILAASRYEPMLSALAREHTGPSYFYYLDVSLAETLRRHETKPLRLEVSPADLPSWYKAQDLLTGIRERVIPESSSLGETVATILAGTQLLTAEILRAAAPGREDLPSWLELVREVEPLFGPMPDFAGHARRAIGRNSALVVRDRHDRVLGAALLSHSGPGRDIRWLAVRADSRRRGAGRVLLTEILRRWPPPGDIEVETFGADVAAGQPARALYESFGFCPAELLPAGPEGGSRQRFVLRRP
jgi:GNAT superfamily N-acetyltransferase/predicted kinase